MLVTSKARLAPIKSMSIPRLEMTAAVLAAKIDHVLKKEITIPLEQSLLWTDSETVLSYINNKVKRFHVFVANRITTIHQLTSPNQWKYVPSSENPADCLTRGLRAEGLCSDKWLQGPAFLRSDQEFKHETKPLCDEDPEVKTEKGIPVNVLKQTQ